MSTEQPTLTSSLRSLPRAAWVLFFGTFLNKFGSFVIPFLTLYLTRGGYPLRAAGLALGAYGTGNLAASLLGGYLADRIGRRRTIVLSMFSGAVAMMLLSQAHTLPSILVLAALAGLTGEMYRPASSALLADLVPAGQRVTAYSALRTAFNAGWAFGPAIAGFLAERGYFWLFAGDALTSVLYGVLAFFALPKGSRAGTTQASWGELVRALRRDRALPRILASAFTIAIVFFQASSTFGLHITHIGFSATTYGAILSLNGAMVVVFELPLTTLTRRFPAPRVISLGFLLAGFGFALLGLATSIPAMVACMAVFTLGEMLSMPMASAYVADLAPPSMRGRYMGAYGMTWTLALVVGPALGMSLLAEGPTVLWLACAALGALAAALALSSPATRAPAG
ncbi:MAG: MFS transporter [Opitutaceae bacterium]|jgi:MFS family permease